MQNVGSNEQQFVFLHSVSAAVEYQPCVVSNATTKHNTSHSFSVKKTLWSALRFSHCSRHRLCATHQRSRANDTTQPHAVGVLIIMLSYRGALPGLVRVWVHGAKEHLNF